MAFASDPDTLVLHGLRLKGFAEIDAVARLVDLEPNEVVKRLQFAEAQQLAKYRHGRVSGWTLTAAGRVEGERRLAEELEAAAAREPVTAAYREFLVHNPTMLQVCTDWQMREVAGHHVVNDHTDPAHDESVVAELERLDDAVQPVCRQLHAVLERFRSYGPRFGEARRRVRAGELDWFTKPTIDSYHTVWFELHENLLATLGIERGNE
jgi:hypothetical protein